MNASPKREYRCRLEGFQRKISIINHHHQQQEEGESEAALVIG